MSIPRAFLTPYGRQRGDREQALSTQARYSLIIAAIALLLIVGIATVVNGFYRHLDQLSELEIKVDIFNPGLQQLDIDAVRQIPEPLWQQRKHEEYRNLFLQQQLWLRVVISNHQDQQQTLIISEKGNYTTDLQIFSELPHYQHQTMLSSEIFRYALNIPAHSRQTVFLLKKGYQLSRINTLYLDDNRYHINQFFSVVTSSWYYGALIGIGLFYLFNITSKTTPLSERLAILSFIAITTLIILIENNFHGLAQPLDISEKNIGRKIAIPLLLIPITSFMLLKAHNISSLKHPLYRLCIVFWLSALALSYSFISRIDAPILYLAFTLISYTHQISWLVHTLKCQQLSTAGKIGSLGFIILNTMMHCYVIALQITPSLILSRNEVISCMYLTITLFGIIMLNDKNISQRLAQRSKRDTEQANARHQSHRQQLLTLMSSIIRPLARLASTQSPIPQRQTINTALEGICRLLYSSHYPHNPGNSYQILEAAQHACTPLYQTRLQQPPPNTLQLFISHNDSLRLIDALCQQLQTGQEINVQYTGDQLVLNDQPFNQDPVLLALTAPRHLQAIAIIDDNIESALQTASLLAPAGYLIEIYTNPLLAEQAIANNRQWYEYAAIVCDYEMPGRNGVDTLTAIAGQHPSHTKNIIYSSISSKISRFCPYPCINKFQPEQLLKALINV